MFSQSEGHYFHVKILRGTTAAPSASSPMAMMVSKKPLESCYGMGCKVLKDVGGIVGILVGNLRNVGDPVGKSVKSRK
jgi:hypothetical protein